MNILRIFMPDPNAPAKAYKEWLAKPISEYEIVMHPCACKDGKKPSHKGLCYCCLGRGEYPERIKRNDSNVGKSDE